MTSVPGTDLVSFEHKIKSTVIPVPSSTSTLKSTVDETIPRPYGICTVLDHPYGTVVDHNHDNNNNNNNNNSHRGLVG